MAQKEASLNHASSFTCTPTSTFYKLLEIERGIQPPTPSWGGMLSDGRESLLSAWWIATFPGLALMRTALSFNLEIPLSLLRGYLVKGRV